jgi:hypothetical protein
MRSRAIGPPAIFAGPERHGPQRGFRPAPLDLRAAGHAMPKPRRRQPFAAAFVSITAAITSSATFLGTGS